MEEEKKVEEKKIPEATKITIIKPNDLEIKAG